MSPSPFSSRPHLWRVAGVYGLAAVALWPVPVFGILHAEASAVLAGVGCLTAAVGAVGPFRSGAGVRALARVHLGALLVPVALLTLSLVWRPNCGYALGLALFLTVVPPSVLFGLGLAYAATGLGVRMPRVTLALAVLAIAGVGVAFDLGLHPQLFTYSHVFGGVLGPIYDEELAVRPGLFAAKAQTVLWALALVALGAWRRGGGRRETWLGGASLVALGVSILAAQPLGIVQTERGIQRVLSETVDLGPVVLHLDPETPGAERRRLADEALYRFETLSEHLGVRPDVPVAVYLYPDADTKAALIGSRITSVVPVWLPTPQIHMLADEVEASLGHEMVHVLAREFGMPVIKASPAVGLVEGLAVALEPPDGLPSPAALVTAGRAVEGDGLGDPAEAVRATMSPGGFWTARAGVAYTANGAFVGWLLDRFGAAPVREAYRTGRFDRSFGQSLAALATEWNRDLARLPVDPEAVAVAQWLFSRPSLFEVRCPHHVPADVRFARAGAEAWEAGEVGTARAAYERAVMANPFRVSALDGALRTRLATGGRATPDDFRRAEAIVDSLPDAAALVHLGDVRRLLGRDAEAAYRAAADSLAPVDALGRLILRQRAALTRDGLRLWLATPPDSVPDRLRVEAPVLAALRLSAADRPLEAWALARTWCPERLLAGLDSAEAAEAGRGLRLIQGTTAYRAGARTASARLYDGLDVAFADGGPRSLAALVRDRARRVAWRRSLAEPPPIFVDPTPAPDALAPCSDARRPVRRGGLRAP
ncbi:hypothetical protein [Rubrivirga marina]|uniref:Uncharacterized protein n=1 Tax=Rubrivirga marina TaxID=1196024 RepID=A0A271J375_9BACT|nr:hypothetical protein [Rubrivirga marina]PAP77415.1 hypothetical protein BSZ37_13700 [Rubrivirga marina]